MRWMLLMLFLLWGNPIDFLGRSCSATGSDPVERGWTKEITSEYLRISFYIYIKESGLRVDISGNFSAYRRRTSDNSYHKIRSQDIARQESTDIYKRPTYSLTLRDNGVHFGFEYWFSVFLHLSYRSTIVNEQFKLIPPPLTETTFTVRPFSHLILNDIRNREREKNHFDQTLICDEASNCEYSVPLGLIPTRHYFEIDRSQNLSIYCFSNGIKSRNPVTFYLNTEIPAITVQTVEWIEQQNMVVIVYTVNRIDMNSIYVKLESGIGLTRNYFSNLTTFVTMDELMQNRRLQRSGTQNMTLSLFYLQWRTFKSETHVQVQIPPFPPVNVRVKRVLRGEDLYELEWDEAIREYDFHVFTCVSNCLPGVSRTYNVPAGTESLQIRVMPGVNVTMKYYALTTANEETPIKSEELEIVFPTRATCTKPDDLNGKLASIENPEVVLNYFEADKNFTLRCDPGFKFITLNEDDGKWFCDKGNWTSGSFCKVSEQKSPEQGKTIIIMLGTFGSLAIVLIAISLVFLYRHFKRRNKVG